MNSLWEKFLENGRVKDCPVYDMHAHMGSYSRIYFPFGDFDPEITKLRLERAGIRMLIFCSHWALFSPDIGNRANIEVARQLPDKLRAYCGINPNYPDIIERDIAEFEKYSDVFVGFKLLADYHQKPISHENYSLAWKYADKKGLIVLLHTWGGSQFDGPEQIRIVAEKYPGARILMGHSCHGAWDKAIQLMKDFPNVYSELCAVVDDRGGLEQFVDAVGSNQIVFGTDWPWFNHHYYIGAVLDSGIFDQDAHNIFHKNAKKLLEGLI
ncbi:MAG: amidohydrolase family protein [Candidatus Omnitrophica bacterium]|nr:amidohydrolase family protein [Candidatus Omnitrophota bacterium]